MNERTIDLHCHSYCSDGTFSPEGLVVLAKQQGLSALALTDHDTIEGLSLFHEAGKKYRLETISGIELATFYSNFNKTTELHIVGLDFDESSPALTGIISFIQTARTKRNQKMVDCICAMGMPITLKEVEENAGGLIITRAHYANVLKQKGYVKSKNEAFEKYISPGKPGYVERETLSPQACIETIKNAGGKAVLAHPTQYSMDKIQLETTCQELKEYGLDALEVEYSTYTPAQRKMLKKIATQYNLAFSGGSDFHGANKPNIQLGTGLGNLSVPYSFLESLRRSN